ncbi:MAG: UDP-N-acetylmuramoyl-L-alanyl-D-glutamate--2,6-diaminopimelate ligase [Parachlamydiales bacterium]|nr:UDP-N-acetylmuramoyl-L-alanyl-D-glutamate--2,6-diaminopimelate ligase [Parachlamydiales bacterium]
MKLKNLLKNIHDAVIRGNKDIDITGLCNNSKVVSPGNLFVAKRGATFDGNHYITDALNGGAVAILTDIYNPFLKNITQIIHPNVDATEAILADEFYQTPSKELFLVGITGTNGKTSTSFLIKQLLEHQQMSCGVIGSVEYIVGQHRYPSTHGTPDLLVNQRLLREMLHNDCKACVMEVTSHGLDQGRVKGLYFHAAIFTNLSHEHLDYHKTMENYAAAKSQLFASLGRKEGLAPIAIVNCDSPWHQLMISNCQAPVITYGMDETADVRAEDILLHPNYSEFTVCYQDQKARFHLGLMGRFNISNCLAAIALGLYCQLNLHQLVAIVANFQSIPGRLQRIDNDIGLHIFVDYAHKPDALENVLQCLKEVEGGRVITVFGCGGNRDRQKRPVMAQISERYSSMSIVTNDNPRDENPQTIISEIVAGFQSKENYLVEEDRSLAISKAIDIAKKGDIVLIAGKGHETYQIFAHKTLAFDDSKVASNLCAQKKQALASTH